MRVHTHNTLAHMAHLFACVFPSGPTTGSFSLVHMSIPFFAWSRNSLQISWKMKKMHLKAVTTLPGSFLTVSNK